MSLPIGSGHRMSTDRFLSITIASCRIEEVDQAVQRVLARIIPDRMRRVTGSLDIYSVYASEPPTGGAHLYKLALYSPRSARDACVTMTNLQDGWNSLNGLVAREHGQFQIQVRSTTDATKYPQNYMEIWRNGRSSRVVYSMRDERGWQFFSSGHAEPFESEEFYERRLKKDRLSRDILIEYLAELGWNIDTPEFWHSDMPAIYFDETKKR